MCEVQAVCEAVKCVSKACVCVCVCVGVCVCEVQGVCEAVKCVLYNDGGCIFRVNRD